MIQEKREREKRNMDEYVAYGLVQIRASLFSTAWELLVSLGVQEKKNTFNSH